MRRAILWIIAILITFAIGTGSDSLRRYLFTKELPAVPNVQAPDVEVVAPLVVTTTPTPRPTPAANLILDYNMDKFLRYGALYIMGPTPEDFSEFNCIELSLGSGWGVDYPGYISVYSGAAQDRPDPASANFALATEKMLYFTTSPSQNEGYQYRFEGEFLVKDFNSVAGKNKAAVRGTLTKSRNGHTIAEATLSFRVYNLGC